MSQDSDFSSSRETLRRQIADDHGFAVYKHYSERDAAAFLRLHPVTHKKIRLGGSIGYISKGRRAIAYFGFQIADYLIDQVRPCPLHQAQFPGRRMVAFPAERKPRLVRYFLRCSGQAHATCQPWHGRF